MKRLLLLVLVTVLIFSSSCNSEPTEAETSDVEISSDIINIDVETTETPVQETEPETTWYYDDYRERRPDLFPEDTGEYPDEVKNTYLTFPLIYKYVANGLEYYIEFYSGTVYMHDYIFVRTTVTNLSDSSVACVASPYSAGFFRRDDGEILLFKHSNDIFSEECDSIGLAAGRSTTFEVEYYVDHEFFKVGHSYTYVSYFSPNFMPLEDKIRIEIPIPIKVAK